MLLALFVTLDLNVTGLGFGIGVGGGSIGGGESGCCELIAAGSAGLPAQAANVVARRTAPAAPQNLRVLMIAISTPKLGPKSPGPLHLEPYVLTACQRTG